LTCLKGLDSAEKPYECFDYAQHERKISNGFNGSSVRPEALEGCTEGFSAEPDLDLPPAKKESLGGPFDFLKSRTTTLRLIRLDSMQKTKNGLAGWF